MNEQVVANPLGTERVGKLMIRYAIALRPVLSTKKPFDVFRVILVLPNQRSRLLHPVQFA